MHQTDDITKILDRLKNLEVTEKKKKYKFDGEYVPRVTEVVSAMLHEESIVSWANGLGFKRIGYRAYMNEAAEKGTFSHLAIQKFLETGAEPDFTGMLTPNKVVQDVVYNAFGGFKSWWEELNKDHKEVEVVYTEHKLTCKYFGGTCDCLLKVDGEYWLIDFKTSSKVRYDHTVQLSAYRYMLKETEDIEVSKCIVLVLNKEDPVYTSYVLDVKNNTRAREYMDYLIQLFMILVAGYRLRLYTENEFGTMFKKKEQDS